MAKFGQLEWKDDSVRIVFIMFGSPKNIRMSIVIGIIISLILKNDNFQEIVKKKLFSKKIVFKNYFQKQKNEICKQ